MIPEVSFRRAAADVGPQHQGMMHIRVAEITIRIAAAESGVQFQVDGPARQFLVREEKPEVSIVTAWGDLSKWTGRDKIFNSGSLWQLYRESDSYLFALTTRSIGPIPYKLAKFNRNFTTGKILFHTPYYNGRNSVHPLEYPLDELLVTHYLSEAGGVEVHACGLIDQSGRGCLFAGQSGVGKTTVARLWQERAGARILSDDRIVLREKAGRIWMYGTPWHGEGRMANPGKAPLERMFLLRQGSGNSLAPLSPAAATARLLACSFPPFHSRRAIESVLGFLDLVVAVPCGELSFTPDDRALRYVEEIDL